MRTTLVIDDDLFRQVKERAAQRGCTFTSIVEEALRATLIESPDLEEVWELPVANETGGTLPGVDLYNARAIRELLDEDSGDHVRS
ncbi:MAG: hypothetical protein ACKN9D_12830 [Actinomycetales bacterium]